MSFDNKNYPNRKDKRRPYRGSKRFDRSCRNHGSCKYCENNRTFFDKKARVVAEEKLNEYTRG